MALLLNSQKKAISPIIAVILLLLMTVAAAGAAFFWIQSTQRQLQAGISEQQEEFQRNLAVDLRVISSEYATGNDLLQIIVANAGGVSVSTPAASTQFTLRFLNGSVVCSTNMTLITAAAGATMPTSIGAGSSGNITVSLGTAGGGACSAGPSGLRATGPGRGHCGGRWPRPVAPRRWGPCQQPPARSPTDFSGIPCMAGTESVEAGSAGPGPLPGCLSVIH